MFTRLQFIRKKMGLTQEELANYFKSKGLNISRGTIAKYESGVNYPSKKTISRLADALEVSEDFLTNNDVKIYDYTEHVKNDVVNCLNKQAQKENQSLYEFAKTLQKSSYSSKTLYNVSLHETLRSIDNTLNPTIEDQNRAAKNLNGNWLLIAKAFGRKLWQNSVSKDKVNLEYFKNSVNIDVEIRMMLICEMFDDILEELRLSNVSN